MDKKQVAQEKRRDLRLSTAVPFTLKLHIKKAKEIFNLRPKKTAEAQNISVGGVRIELPLLESRQIDRIIDGKDKLVLELDISYLKRPIKVLGKIVWLEKRDRHGKTFYVAGICFEGVSEKKREDILKQLVNVSLHYGCTIE